MEKAVADRSSTKKPPQRKKVEKKLIEKMSSRNVTFSKRRPSIFQKASDLSTLCGAEVAVMMFSPGGRIYSFGHPSLEAVIERFESLALNPNGSAAPQRNQSTHGLDLRAGFKAAKTHSLKVELEQILEKTESLKRKKEMVDLSWEKELELNHWWNADVNEMDLASCKEMERKLMELKMEVELEEAIRSQQSENNSNKLALVGHDGWNFAPNYGHLMSSHSTSVYPNNLGSEWINPFSGPSDAIAGMLDFNGGGTSNFEPIAEASSSSGNQSETLAFGMFGPNKYLFSDSSHTNFDNVSDNSRV